MGDVCWDYTLTWSGLGTQRERHPSLEPPSFNNSWRWGGDFPPEFCATDLIHSTDKHLWCRMVGFVLAELGDLLLQVGLYKAVRAIQCGLPQSTQHFYAVLERYNPETCTFFTPLGEMGLALHEMCEVSGLVMGDAPYEEYVPTSEELHLLRKEDPQVYETYWEVLCHFHICE